MNETLQVELFLKCFKINLLLVNMKKTKKIFQKKLINLTNSSK